MDPSRPHAAATRPAASHRLPGYVRLPMTIILALALRMGFYTLLQDLTGPELSAISRDLQDNPYDIGMLYAWKLTELVGAWMAGYDFVDAASLSVLAQLPYYYLITTFYSIPLSTAALSFSVEVASTTIPFFLLRGLNHSHDPTDPTNTSAPNRALASDKSIIALVTLLGASIQSIIVFTSFYTWFPSYIIVHFDGLRSLARAHDDGLVVLVRSFLPTGLAAMFFLFAPTIGSSQNPGMSKPKTVRFDPATASLGDTVAFNLGLGESGLTHRAEVLAKRTAALMFAVFANTVVRTYLTIEGADLEGAMAYAGLWASTSLCMGLAYGWVSNE